MDKRRATDRERQRDTGIYRERLGETDRDKERQSPKKKERH